jgi:hypothetical protein
LPEQLQGSRNALVRHRVQRRYDRAPACVLRSATTAPAPLTPARSRPTPARPP